MFAKLDKGSISELRNRKLLLFGAGARGSYALEELNKIGAHIVGFIDNDPKKHGKKINGYTIYSPEEISKFRDTKLIIASIYFQEIKKQLLEMGIYDFDVIYIGAANDKIAQKEFSRPFLSKEEANEFIYKKLLDNTPFFVGRLGSNELECMTEYYYLLNRDISKANCYHDNLKVVMKHGAGFYPPKDAYLDKMVQMYTQDLKQMDLIWNMWFSRFENMLYEQFTDSKQKIAIYCETAFPYDIANPWTAALKEKKVLVIHPFEKSIRQNYKIKDKLHKNVNFLPNFQLLTIKSIQSAADEIPEYDNWFDALNAMQQKIDSIDFDIALIGAGAYGLPLAAYCKRIGKKALQIGGRLQLYFGIRGKVFNKLNVYNTYWTFPKKEEHPKGYEKVERGRYW